MLSQRPGTNGLDALLFRHRERAWQQFRQRPVIFLTRKLFCWQLGFAPGAYPPGNDDAISIVCISDTHNSQPELPDRDILIHAGDLTEGGTLSELQATLDWLHSQPHRHKIVIAGNHDLLLDSAYGNKSDQSGLGEKNAQRAQLNWGDIVYL